MRLRQTILKILINFYPPFLGAGIRIKLDKKNKKVYVSMKLTWYNRNYVGTQFGGSIYAMCDPFYMFLLMEMLGSNYIVWDKKATIDFIKPGKSTLHAEFFIDDQTVEAIKTEVKKNGKALPQFTVAVKDDDGEVIARVDKHIYVKKKK